jgi:CheY-like chemotaxis protein
VEFRATGSGPAETASDGFPFEAVLPSKDKQSAARMALARAYALVREWGGDVVILSDPAGARLSLYLGAAPGEAAPPEPRALSPEHPQGEGATRETILLVDDEAGIRGLVRRILLRERYNVLEASAGEEAMALVLQHPGPIHLLLTDVMMPGMSGPDLAQAVRGRLPGIKVVFMSGYSERPPAERVPEALFLQKPFTLADLLLVVSQALE